MDLVLVIFLKVKLYDEAISLPILSVSIQQQNYVIKCLNDIISLEDKL